MVRDAGISTPATNLQPPTEFHVWRGFEGSLAAQQVLLTQYSQRQPPAQTQSSRANMTSIRGAAAVSPHQLSPLPVTASARRLFRSLQSYNESAVLALDVLGGALHLWATSDSSIQLSADSHGMEVMGTWQLPPKKQWSSICALG